jgi:hypothetical protein
LAIGALSVLASNRRLLEAGRFLNLAQLSASGLSFLAVGVALGPQALGLLAQKDLTALRPVVALGLGLGGLMMGLNLDLRVLRRLPRAVYRASLAQSGVGFALVTVPLAGLLFATAQFALPQALGAAALLGAAASISSGHLAVLWSRSGRLDRGRGLSVALLAMLDDLMGVLVLAVALVLGAASNLGSGLGLVALAVLLGLSCGALVAYLAHAVTEVAELAAIQLGGLALVAGAAAYLRVSALIAGLACGAVLALVGGRAEGAMYRSLLRVERPAYLMLVFLIGAHVDPRNALTWAILPVFVGLRFVGKVVGGRLAGRALRGVLAVPPRLGYALIAQGGVSLCVVTEYLVLVPGAGSELVFSVAALAALANEALAARAFASSLEPTAAVPARAGEGGP